ncbi:amino acid ABC transporter permease [Roseomonas sp. OT10]|uniref:amino acid ABC transporter permease n=1 Tax=Roseomonas cutis TaxID=2897332 RepID=UPI001E2B1243|nr:amino acid ABC transporter permease [Roseomonas sp. OT10]UFN51069.1 amino acid ABC transporter permease [Roseomonas sp. OT10]
MNVLVQAFWAAVQGLPLTLLIWLGGSALGMVLGLLVACLRHLGPAPFNWVLGVVVELFRGTPFLVQSFLLYYGGPFIGLDLPAVGAGLLALSLYGGAYFSEIFRGAFAAVPRAQLEAARICGLSHAQTVARVLLPGAALAALPSLVNMTILMVKETAVLSIITVPEITFRVSSVGTATFAFAPAMMVLAVFYWALVEAMATLGRLAERVTAKALAA